MPELAGRDGHYHRQRTRRLRRQAQRENTPCWLCGKRIDFDLYYTHKGAFTLDHVVPLSQGGKLAGEMRPAHRSCNSARGDGTQRVQPQRVQTSICTVHGPSCTTGPHSREW